MLMLAILSWGRDLIVQPAQSAEAVHLLRQRIGSDDRDFIIFDGNFLFPLKLDYAVRQLSEEEIVEWLHADVFPALEEEGLLTRKNGRFVKA